MDHPTDMNVKQSISHVALVVRDYDEAIAFLHAEAGLHSRGGHRSAGAEQAMGYRGASRIHGHGTSTCAAVAPGAGALHRQPDGRARHVLSAHRQFLAGLSSHEGSRHRVRARAGRSGLRDRRGVQGSLRQSMGSRRTGTRPERYATRSFAVLRERRSRCYAVRFTAAMRSGFIQLAPSAFAALREQGRRCYASQLLDATRACSGWRTLGASRRTGRNRGGLCLQPGVGSAAGLAAPMGRLHNDAVKLTRIDELTWPRQRGPRSLPQVR